MLVTRPQPAAAHTAARLDETGFVPLVLPLSETVALTVETVLDPVAFDAVAITSSNAIRHAPADLLARLRGKQCFAVGTRSGKAANEAGFSVLRDDAGDGLALAAQIAATARPGSSILYLCGKVRGAAFEASLSDADLAVRALETYDTREICYTTDAVSDAIGWNPIWGAVVYSAGGAGRLAALMERPQLTMVFSQTRLFCLSERTAAGFGEDRRKRAICPPDPTEEALLKTMVTA